MNLGGHSNSDRRFTQIISCKELDDKEARGRKLAKFRYLEIYSQNVDSRIYYNNKLFYGLIESLNNSSGKNQSCSVINLLRREWF